MAGKGDSSPESGEAQPLFPAAAHAKRIEKRDRSPSQSPSRSPSPSPPPKSPVARARRSPSRSYSRSPSRSPARGGRSPGRSFSRSPDRENVTVFVGNLTDNVTERDLRAFFEAYGSVQDAKVVYDQEGVPRGFGFVRFETSREADNAVMHARGKTLDGEPIRCNLARYPPGSRGAPRGRGGRGRGRGERGRGFRRGGEGSPERWGERSPPPSGSSPSRSRSFSRSPPPSRKRTRRPRSASRSPSPPPQRQHGRKAAARRAASPTPSSASMSGSSSSGASGSPRPSPPVKRRKKNKDSAYKKELAQAKREREEMAGRIAMLEQQVKDMLAANEGLQSKCSKVSSRLKSIAERSKKRGLMLGRLTTAVRSVSDAKVRLREAEVELDSVTAAAVELMQQEELEYQREAADAKPPQHPQPQQPQQQTMAVKHETENVQPSSTNAPVEAATIVVAHGEPSSMQFSMVTDHDPTDNATPDHPAATGPKFRPFKISLT